MYIHNVKGYIIYKIFGWGIYIDSARLGAVRTLVLIKARQETSLTINIVRRSYCRLWYGHVYGTCTHIC